jgi:hypothetical protein
MSDKDYTERNKLAYQERKPINEIRRQWQKLISSENVRETQLHEFLATHARLFFCDDFNFGTVVSKLRFGALKRTGKLAVDLFDRCPPKP